MEKHERFTQWAVAQGVEINGVACHKFPGRGLGIVATKEIKNGDILISVPTSALRSRASVPKSISSKLPGITTHGLLATYLALDTLPEAEPWRAVLPSFESFKSELPLLWSEALQQHLPSPAAKLLAQQKEKFAIDWTQVSSAFPEIPQQDFLHAWILVNTRTFYYTPPNKSRSKKPVDPNENMALNPFADYFNHSSPPTCTATYSSAGFEIGAVRSAKKGEEVYISYGAHSNDFLLTEYGFVMDENENDSVSLDDVVMAKLVEGGKEEQVKDAGFWGKYTLDKEGVCYRTQVALRSLIMTERRWERFVSGADEGRDEEGKYVELLQGILLELQDSVTETIYELNKLETDEKEARGTLVRRWKQIIGLLNHVFESTIR